MWRVTLFGGPIVERGRERLERISHRASAHLFAALALDPAPHERLALAERIWPEGDPAGGRNRLKQALALLRRELEPLGEFPLIVLGQNLLQWDGAAVSTDVFELERTLESLRRAGDDGERRELLERALRLARHPLLPGLDDFWIAGERERWLAEGARLTRDAVALLEARGDIDRALELAHENLARDPLREESNALLVELLCRQGQADAARRAYRRLEDALRTSPGFAFPELSTPVPIFSRKRRAWLPAPLTPIFARGRELEAIRDAFLGGVRLMTLMGSGGVGKTRLALEASRHLADHFDGAAWFVPLATARRGEDLTRGLAQALVASEDSAATVATRAGESPEDIVTRRLREVPRALLTLDNLEQIDETGAGAILRLLELLPNVVVLATSRRSLGIVGERRLELSPLSSDLDRGLDDAGAIQCFAFHARAANPSFELDAATLSQVQRICQRVDGLPLALELAAGWTRSLTCSQIVHQLDDHFALMVSPRPPAPTSPGPDDVLERPDERHATLRATIAWSFQLLSEPQRRFLIALSVFPDSWTLEAALAITGDPAGLRHLAALREHSLLQAHEDAGVMRYSFLVSVRAFAREALTPDDRERLARHHARHYAAAAQEILSQSAGVDVWGAAIAREYANLTAAMETLLTLPGESGRALRMASALSPYWELRGYLSEGGRWLDRALEHPRNADATSDRAWALLAAANLARARSDIPAALARYDETITLMRRFNDRSGLAEVLLQVGLIRHYPLGEVEEATALFTESLTLHRRLDNRRGIVHALKCLGALELDRASESAESAAKARTCFDEALRLCEADDDRAAQCMVLAECARLELAVGDTARARERILRHRAIAEAIELEQHLVYGLRLMASIECADGRLEAAATAIRQARERLARSEDQHQLGFVLMQQAKIARDRKLRDDALAALDEAEPLFHHIDDTVTLAAIAAERAAIERERPGSG